MARLTNDQRMANIHAEAMAQFDDIQSALRDERLQCLQDRRFYSICGAQWERYTPTFDENGLLVPPAGAQVYPLDLKTTIEIK